MSFNEHLHVRELLVEVERLENKVARLEQMIEDKDLIITKIRGEMIKTKYKPTATKTDFIKRSDLPRDEWKQLLAQVS